MNKKAILVIDIPDKSIEDWVVEELKIIKYDIDGNFIDGNDYCHGKVKLKPMPTKYDWSHIDTTGVDPNSNDFDIGSVRGWNECLDEILGGEE